MSYLKLKNINKIYPNGFQAVYDFNIDIQEGDFVALLGPSGCGKTTTLRMIAGLEEISSGEMTLKSKIVNEDGSIEVVDKVINNLPPVHRDVGMVFQDYALYPHLTVYENMAFSMIIQRKNKDTIHELVMNAANMLGLTPYLKRKPKQLSGGQRQRVALGRTIVRQPSLFLMDEPMSNLDAKLRNEMRIELVELHKALNATTVYVTHDQIEALTMANVIVVMDKGYVQQIGSGKQIYDYPENLFVSTFIGVPTITIIEGIISGDHFVSGDLKIKLNKVQKEKLSAYQNKEILVGIRPEYFSLKQDFGNKITLKLDVVELMGHEYFLHTSFNGSNVVARIPSGEVDFYHGQIIDLYIDSERVHYFDKTSTKRIKMEDDK